MSSEPNTLKWPSIDGAVSRLFAPSALADKLERARDDNDDEKITALRNALQTACADLRLLLFKNPLEGVTVKVDGTNVGHDSEGRVYGRNQMVAEGVDNYLQTSLSALKAVDVAGMKKKLFSSEVLGAETSEDLLELVDRFVVYGELACNKMIYDYAHAGVAAGWLIFGAMIKLKKGCGNDAYARLRNTLLSAGFAATASDTTNSDEEDGAAEASIGLRVPVNPRFREQFPNLPYAPQLPASTGAKTFANLIENDDALRILAQGRQEGLVVLIKRSEVAQGKSDGVEIIPNTKGNLCELLKWKNGHEPPGSSIRTLERVKQMVTADKGANEAGDLLKTAFEMEKSTEEFDRLKLIIDRLLSVYNNTERIDLNPDGSEKQKNTKPTKSDNEKVAGKNATKKPHPNKVYNDAILSARTKFDHCDTFFARGSGRTGFNEYAKLIADEAVGDVAEALEIPKQKTDSSEEWKKEHLEKVTNMLEKEWKRWSAES